MTVLTRSVMQLLTMLLFLVTCLPPNDGTALASDLSIYADSITTGWADWSWNTTSNFSNTSPVHNGPYSLSVTFNSGWAGLYLHANSPVDTSGYDQLRFWVNGGSAGNQKLQVVANGDGSNSFPVTIQAKNWTEVNVPLSALGSPATLADLYWQDTTGGSSTHILHRRCLTGRIYDPASTSASSIRRTGPEHKYDRGTPSRKR